MRVPHDPIARAEHPLGDTSTLRTAPDGSMPPAGASPPLPRSIDELGPGQDLRPSRARLASVRAARQGGDERPWRLARRRENHAQGSIHGGNRADSPCDRRLLVVDPGSRSGRIDVDPGRVVRDDAHGLRHSGCLVWRSDDVRTGRAAGGRGSRAPRSGLNAGPVGSAI